MAEAEQQAENVPFERLPTSVIPSHYAISLTPDLVALKFDGEETIQVQIKERVSFIRINSADLEIHEASVQPAGSENTIKTSGIHLTPSQETLTLDFPELEPGDYNLYVKFSGILNDTMKGFYRSKYVLNGETRYIATTQFEPCDARRAFPCWDEPAVKATFSITLIAPKDRVALSNMPVEQVQDRDDGKQVVQFAKTPKMSTYLVAFIVGEFDYVEKSVDNDRIKIRVYTPVGKAEQGEFALDVAVKTLPLYERLFGSKFPLPKLDLISIADFSSGAMENWGLVTFAESAMLVDPKGSSISEKRWVALVVAHEFAHQWFGNLVTMEWWTHLWLNEGFATWVEYLAVDHCFPNWNLWNFFVLADLAAAFRLDGLRSSHPIEVEVNDPKEVDEIFDNISYSKGCSVIRMLYHYLGEEHFRSGLINYLNTHAYANALTGDLWLALEQSSQQPVQRMMESWTKQIGFPVIKVRISPDNPQTLLLEQRRFLSSGTDITPEEDLLYSIPLTVATSESALAYRGLFETRQTEIPRGSGTWLKLNSDQAGFYRVHYESDELRESLLRAIEAQAVPSPRDRMGIVNDAFALNQAGIVPCWQVFELLNAYQNEHEYIVWTDLSRNLQNLIKILAFSDFSKEIDWFGQRLFSRIVSAVGWDAKPDEEPTVSLLRPVVLLRAGSFGDRTVIDEALRRLDLYVKDNSSLSADLRSMVYSISVKFGGQAAYETVFKIFNESDFPTERERALSALTAATEPELLQRTLDFALNSDSIRGQDGASLIVGVGSNVRGRDLAWEFTKKNWDALFKRYPGFMLLNDLVKGVTSSFTDLERANEIRQFFDQTPLNKSRGLDQSLETIRNNAAWLARESDSLRDWLKNFRSSVEA